jgi:hypothetical protein
MNSILITSVVFIAVFGEALLGMFVRRWIPSEYLGTDTKDVVRLVTGICATMSGIVLGMLVASAKSYYDARTNEVAELATEVVTIDRVLARYGPETDEIRSRFYQSVESRAVRLWESQESMASALRPQENMEALLDQLKLLTPKSETQIAARTDAIPMIVGLQQTHWRMFLRTQQTSMPVPLLVVVVSWLGAIFASIGLFAPRDSIVLVAFAVGALIVSTAVWIIVEMYSPFKGIFHISQAPILDAVNQMKH